ncbi:MAG: CRISPR-associated endonuclease Cas6 [Bacteroidota bacterium]
MKEAKKIHLQEKVLPLAREINLLNATIDLPLRFDQISEFRGALIAAAGREYDLLHNHREGDKKYEYRYPLIQYRVHRGRAMLVGYQAGAESLRAVLLKVRNIQLNNKTVPLRLHQLREKTYTLRMSEQPRYYRLQHWLALNQENYQKWLALDNLQDRILLLERALNGHLLSFAQAMQWQLPERLEVRLRDLIQHKTVKYHNTPLIAFDVEYRVNLNLPPLIGLGKASSHGFGWQIGSVEEKKR